MNITFLEQTGSETTIVTPNRRLSATLHKLYQQQQLAADKTQWFTPDILPLSSWLQRLFYDFSIKHFTAFPLLLNAAQEQFLWEKIVTESKDSEQLLQITETAELAKTAWGLLKQWQVSIHHPLFNSTDDYITFAHWAMQFQAHCEKKNYMDLASLPDFLHEKIKSSVIPLPKQLILVGFTESSPQLKALLATCEELGCEILYTDIKQEEAHCFRLAATDKDNEILCMARWAKSRFVKSAHQRIGCVIPSLEKIRDRVVQIFSEVFADSAAFNISAGKSLINYPVIHTAIQLLSLHKQTLSAETLSQLLLSPFHGASETERIQRSQFEGLLKQHNINRLDLRVLTQANQGKLSFEKHCPQFAKQCREFLLQLDGIPSHQSHAAWANVFNQLLTAMGWPGERSLSSEEYQVVNSWMQLLTDFKTLDNVGSTVTLQQALKTLHKMTASTLFQPQTPDAPIQVLGLLEAAALPFDALWIGGMDDLAWPPQPKPNPFIPKRLQRELQMPHATAERELLFCNILLRQFKQSATTLIFSHAEKENAIELQASPLIKDIPLVELNDLHLEQYASINERLFASGKITTFVDEQAPEIRTEEKIYGGVSIIKQQACCPFKAFAEWRLHAKEMEEPVPGLRAKDRGKIIHRVMELFWNQVQSQETLIALQEAELRKIIESSIESALTPLPLSHHAESNYIELERKRLYKLVTDWLEVEKNRSHFKVLTHEKTVQINLHQLNLSVRIDRIDQLADGQYLIIDYKTGKNNEIGDWFSDRPEEPQLPLYSLIETHSTFGISFAQIAPGANEFKGVSRYAINTKGIRSLDEVKHANVNSWEEQIAEWKNTLTRLSDDFYQGKAQVDPKDNAQTCMWCALKPLCRINESQDGKTNE